MPVIRTNILDIAYEEHGNPTGAPVILMHGFPYDPRCYDAMLPLLADCRVIVPYLRGFGPTRFLSAETMRSGQQGALAKDLIDLMDGLGLAQAALLGYDWGGRAACIVAALWPERVRCLVTGNGYNIQNIAASVLPAAPETEHRIWYQYYLHTPRGAAGLAANRAAFCRLLWKLWSPTWQFDDATYQASAVSFDNPDFVDVVIHSYRHRFAYIEGDPAYAEVECRLAAQPPISVPTIALWGNEGVMPPSAADRDVDRFTGFYRRDILPGIGHNYPQEAPLAAAAALRELLKR
jgi:pimeloyl-ACP methyl ester carboxylesterase